MPNDECRINFDKHVSLRDENGVLVGEAVVTMKFGEILINAQINPLSGIGQALMRTEGSLSIGYSE